MFNLSLDNFEVFHMPTYDYKCTQCLTQFVAQHAIATSSPACPACGGMVRKLILSPPATHGSMAQGRQLAMDSLRPGQEKHAHGPGCGCAHHS